MPWWRWLFGENPLTSILGSLGKAYEAKLNAQNNSERAQAEVEIKRLEAQVAAIQNALQVRLATAGHPEQRFLAFVAGGTAVLHYAVIGIGTTFATPLGWGWLQWTRQVPAFPPPFDAIEAGIILSFFGLVGAVSIGKSIAGAIAMRGAK